MLLSPVSIMEMLVLTPDCSDLGTTGDRGDIKPVTFTESLSLLELIGKQLADFNQPMKGLIKLLRVSETD